LASLLYIDDNEGVLPSHEGGPVMSYYSWGGKRGKEYLADERLINPYVTINRKVKQDDNEGVFRVFKCPKDNGAMRGRWNADRKPSLFDTFGNSYFYNSGGNSNGPDGLHGKKMAAIRSPCSRSRSAIVGRFARRSVRPLLTLIAPLRAGSSPVMSEPRVGVHIGEAW